MCSEPSATALFKHKLTIAIFTTKRGRIEKLHAPAVSNRGGGTYLPLRAIQDLRIVRPLAFGAASKGIDAYLRRLLPTALCLALETDRCLVIAQLAVIDGCTNAP